MQNVFNEQIKPLGKHGELTAVISRQYERDAVLDKDVPLKCFIYLYKTIADAMIDVEKFQRESKEVEVMLVGNGWFYRLFFKRAYESMLVPHMSYRTEYYFDLNGQWCNIDNFVKEVGSDGIRSSIITQF
jgi:nicotinamide mononucleotide adenylyltransferase